MKSNNNSLRAAPTGKVVEHLVRRAIALGSMLATRRFPRVVIDRQRQLLREAVDELLSREQQAEQRDSRLN